MADTSAGVRLRVDRLFDERSGKAACFALAHGRYGYPPRGIEDLATVTDAMQRLGVEGLTFNVGGFSRVAGTLRGKRAPSVILCADTYFTSTMPGLVLSKDREVLGEAFRIVATADEMARLGADMVKVYLWFGMDDLQGFADNVAALTATVRRCNEIGLPVMVEPVPWGTRMLRKVVPERAIADMVRMACEFGADILKMPALSEDALRDVVRTTSIPILVTDSPDASTDQIFHEAEVAVRAGAAGILFGSPTTGTHAKPLLFVSLLRRVVHEGLKASEAIRSLETLDELVLGRLARPAR